MKKIFLLTVAALTLSYTNPSYADHHEGHDHNAMVHDHGDMAQPAMDATAPTSNPNISLEVNGLVCDFCAQAIDKVFRKQDAVQDISVNLSDKNISIWTKEGKTLDDKLLTQLVNDAGYSLVNITREHK